MINTAKLMGKLRECGKTQADLAAHLGMAQSTMNQKLNGKRPLFLDEADKIAHFLKIPDTEFGVYFFARDSA